MIDSELRDELLDRLRATPARMRTMVDGMNDATLRRAGPDGGWGAVEIFCHLRDWDEIYTERIERLLDEDEPTIPAVDDTLWPIEREYHNQNPRKALDEFAAGRTRLVEILNTLRAGEWLRGGHHPYYGRQTIAWYAEHCADHDQEHIEQLRTLLQS
jgi:hypothetical protein